jgi:surface polysaccharide O-acyltransferase-like enzyme
MYKNLLYLNGVAVILAVLNHAIYRVLPAMISAISGAGADSLTIVERFNRPNLIVIQLADQVAVWAVPVFLFISGCFMAIATPKASPTIPWRVVLGRIKNIAIPYLIWSGLVFGWLIFRGEGMNLAELILALTVKGVVAPYYYVPMLMSYMLLSPFIVPLARNNWKHTLIIIALMQISFPLFGLLAIVFTDNFMLLRYLDLLAVWKSPLNLFWFTLGMVVGFKQAESKIFFEKIRVFAIVLLPVAVLLNNLEINYVAYLSNKIWIHPQDTLFYQFSVLLAIMIWIGSIKTPLPFYERLNTIGLISFGVYLIHFPLMIEINRSVVAFLPALMNVGILWAFVIAMITLLITILFIRIFDTAPIRRYKRYLVG